MQILGLGNDIIEIGRIRQALTRHGHRFLRRVFTEQEQRYCNQYQDPAVRYAARFAAKEAIAKAFGLGIGDQISWRDLEIINDARGQPRVQLSDALSKKYAQAQILISLSHSELYATAVAVWVGT